MEGNSFRTRFTSFCSAVFLSFSQALSHSREACCSGTCVAVECVSSCPLGKSALGAVALLHPGIDALGKILGDVVLQSDAGMYFLLDNSFYCVIYSLICHGFFLSTNEKADLQTCMFNCFFYKEENWIV